MQRILFSIFILSLILFVSCCNDNIIGYRLEGWKSIHFYYDNDFHDPTGLTNPYFLKNGTIRDSTFGCSTDSCWSISKVDEIVDTIWIAWTNQSKYYPTISIIISDGICRGIKCDTNGFVSNFKFKLTNAEKILLNYGVAEILNGETADTNDFNMSSLTVGNENANFIRLKNDTLLKDFLFDFRECDYNLLLLLDVAMTIVDNHRSALSEYIDVTSFWQLFLTKIGSCSPFTPPPPSIDGHPDHPQKILPADLR